jgi:uncharacterized protein YndB with AHSA1/START domain
MRILVFALILAAASASMAHAEVVSSSPSAFQLQASADVAASPARAWRALKRIDRWWNGDHTYSGDARNLRLDPRAGGCWCERWSGGQSVEHGRVVLVMEREGVKTLRVLGALGPLQDMGVSAVLTFTIAPEGDGAKITMTYRVAGDPSLNLNALAPVVDGVLNEQFQRLARYAATDDPAD